MVTIAQIDKQIWEKEHKNVNNIDKSINIFKPYKGGILGLNPG